MGLTHLDGKDNPSMVNVGEKVVTKRVAVAQSLVQLNDEIMSLLVGSDLKSKKGPVFQTAIIAGVMGAKKTSELIPLCHPIGLDNCQIEIGIQGDNLVKILSTASCTGKTGVEMEALTGATVAALTIYDMCKALSHEIEILSTKLISKTGGKSDYNASV